jgi:hypothetical protein
MTEMNELIGTSLDFGRKILPLSTYGSTALSWALAAFSVS